MFKSSSSTGKLAEAVSPIYQKVLGCQLSPAGLSSTSSPELNMADPAAALRSLLNTKRTFGNDLSVTIPTSSVFSYTPRDSISNPSTGLETSPLARYPSSRLENDHVFLPEEQTTCSDQSRDATLLPRQEQFNVFRSDSIHLQEKDFESMSRLQTNALSPVSDSRLSEGDQTVPHSVSPVTESPGFVLNDESSVQATFVPPPEVLELPSSVPLKTFTVGELQLRDLDAIHSLDNFEYCIQKVDQHSHKTQDFDKSQTAKLGYSTNKTSDMHEDNKMDELITDNCLKSPRHHKIFKNKNDTPVRIQIDKDEDCYVIENKISKADESMNDVMICHKTCGDIMKTKMTCEDGSTERITLEEGKVQNKRREGLTEEDEVQKQLDEEQSEMRRYYLEADKRPTFLVVATEKETMSYLSENTVLGEDEIQNGIHTRLINSTELYNKMERKSDKYGLMNTNFVKQHIASSDLHGGLPNRFVVCSEKDHCFPRKETQEKRYYLKDGTYSKDIEPGEIIHNCSEDGLRNPTPCFNVSLGETPTYTHNGKQIRNCLTEYPKLSSAIYGERSFISETSNYVNPTSVQIPFERHLLDYGNYYTGYQNASFLNPLPDEVKTHPANVTSQNYSSILFPVNINNGNPHAIPEATSCTEQSILTGKLHESHIKQKGHNASSSSLSSCYGIFQEHSNECLPTREKTNSKLAISCKSKSCKKPFSSRRSTVDSAMLKSGNCRNPTKNTRNHLNGIIDKLWVSKTCLNDSGFNQNSSSVTKQKYEVLKSGKAKFSKGLTSVLDFVNAKKSENDYVKMFECSTCGFQDKEYAGIEKHIVENHKPDGCTCDSCGETLVNHCQCQGRIKISSKAITFACNICKKLCRTRFGLRRHKAKKHGADTDIVNCLSAYQPPYTCTVCSEDQHTYTRYKQHMSAHGVNSPFRCKTCDKSFHSKNGLALHFAKVHR